VPSVTQGAQGAPGGGPQGAQGATGGVTGAQGAPGPTGPSDIRLKTNVQNLDSALEIVKKLRGVSYNWVDGLGKDTTKLDIGFIAQEIQQYLPELIMGSEEKYYGVKYKEVVALTIAAIKEQEAKITELEIRAQRILDKAQQTGLII
jgi:hypothetical protein